MFQSLRDMKLSRKFAFGFGAVCVLCLILGGSAVLGFIKVNSQIDDLANDTMPSMKALGDVRYGIASVRRSDALALSCSDAACIETYRKRHEEFVAIYNNALKAYQPLMSYPGERELYESFSTGMATYMGASTRIFQLLDAGNHDQAAQLLNDKDLRVAYQTATNASEQDMALNVRFGKQDGERAMSTTHNLLALSGVLMALVLGACMMIGIAMTRLIVSPIEEVTCALERIATKDLTASVEVGSEDEIGRLATALNLTAEAMRATLKNVATGAETLSAAAEELSVRSTQTSGNTQSQTAKINQIAAAVQEMTATIGEISHNAGAASVASRTSAETANEGGMVMERTSATMQQIATTTGGVSQRMSSLTERSAEIGKVVSVIQEISEQTNLLALNAAIEAARAGEHGRGFAVVAGEVRRLAERTKSATEEIAVTIRSIQEETRSTADMMAESGSTVQAGLTDTAQAQSSLAAIISSSRDVEHMVQLIATAATEQTAASGEIAENTGYISQLAGENTQASEEIASACSSLSILANDLDGLIRQFRLDDDVQQGSRQGRSAAAKTGVTAR
jgi:methyl-accepting chemotaxis protein